MVFHTPSLVTAYLVWGPPKTIILALRGLGGGGKLANKSCPIPKWSRFAISFAVHCTLFRMSHNITVLLQCAGLLMMVDTLEERGLSVAELKWGDRNRCHFPLFDFLQPLPSEWMCLLCLLMWLGMFIVG